MKSKVINTASPSKQSKVKPYLEKLGRFALTGLVTFGIGTLMIHERYNNYWNKTIFRVQTVDFNILSYTLPTKLSYTIIKNQPKELQHTLDSNYGLSGLIVTDASGQKVIASSTNPFSHHPWATDIGTENLQNHPYDLLLDPPPLFSQWNYSGPHAVERSATNLTNLGRVIGRVYYIRGVNPPFQKDFLAWLKNPFSGSSRDKSYTEVMVACLAGGMAFWIFLEYILHKKRVQQEQAEQREQVLIDQNKTLQLKLAERIAQIFQITTQWEQERQAAIANAEKLRSHNQQLLQDISQLKNTMSSVSNATDSNLTQVEIERIQRQADSASQKQQQQQDEIKRLNEQLRISKNQLEIANQQISKQKELESKIQSIEMAKSQAESKLNELRSKQDKDANTFYQKQQEQQDEIKWLNEKLKSYKNQLRTVNPQTSKQQEIQSQIRSIELAKSKAESELSELRNNENKLRVNITNLEKQLASQLDVQNQLNRQMRILEQALRDSQLREEESRTRAESANQQITSLLLEKERIEEDMGKHELNRFERKVLNCLKTGLPQKEILTQFDLATGNENSRFTDFILVLSSCMIVIEAKSYEGLIKSTGDPRNSNWICVNGNYKITVNACWGLNPYQQVKSYTDKLLQRINKQAKKIPVYGVVVFPSQAKINANISSNIGGFQRVTTLNNLIEIIQEIEIKARSQNNKQMSPQQIVQMVTEVN